MCLGGTPFDLGLNFTKCFQAEAVGFLNAHVSRRIGLENHLNNDAVTVHVVIEQILEDSAPPMSASAFPASRP